jgi:AraC-like DNA-binding protein/mannose-6-phosphate isomerase-like protein (cupin superfamily)
MDAIACFCQKLLVIGASLPHLIEANETYPDPNWCTPSHHHSCHELIMIKSGSMLLKTPDHEMTANGSDLLFYPAGLVHQASSHRSDPVSMIYIQFSAPGGLPEYPLQLRDRENRIQQLANWMVEDIRNGRSHESCRPLLHAILAELHKLCTHSYDFWVENLRTYMRANLGKPIFLSDLATQGDMSLYAFVRKFKRLTGRTPMAELRLIRLNEARHMIVTSNLPLKTIASRVCLGDEYQLSKLFRKHFGVSTRQMRHTFVSASLPSPLLTT